MPHRRSSSSSPILSPPLLIIILPIILLLFLFVALPPFLSFTSQLLRPTSVKKSWDSLNILFVLFAILCGVFAKRNDEDSPSEEEEVETVRARATWSEKSVEREDGSVSRQWYGFSENKNYDSPPIVRLQSPVAGVSRLRRSSSSYPDLRQESLWETESDGYRFRFFDEFEIGKFRSPEKEQIPVENPDHQENVEKVGEDADVKEIQVDTVEIRSSSPLPPQPVPKSPTPPVTPPPPPPPPPPATTRPKSRPTYQTISRKEKLESVEVDDNDITGNPSPPRPPSPPPPPPGPAVQTEWEHKRGRNQRRKSEIAIMWASLLNQKKRKRKQRTTAAKVDHIQNEDNVSARQPPPPPPPPPPPSVFHSWFKKGVGKNKKIHSVSTPPPPAPPPPPPLTSSKRWSFRKPKIPTPPPPPPPPATEPRRRRNAGRPPLPTRTSTFNNETLLNSGNQSPLIPIPPPPPPLFKIPEMKFTVRGDFVKIRSTNSSRCGSPERDDDPKPNEDPPELEMGGTIPCPSPDVNVKASTFIARLRGEWKLEKINSMKEKQNLGLYGPGPTRGPSSSWH